MRRKRKVLGSDTLPSPHALLKGEKKRYKKRGRKQKGTLLVLLQPKIGKKEKGGKCSQNTNALTMEEMLQMSQKWRKYSQ